MAVTRGRLGTVELSTDGGSTFNAIGKIIDAEIAVESSEITVTSHDSDDWEEFLQGRKSANIEVSCRYDEADAGQDAAVQLMYDEAVGDIRFRARGATLTAREYTASCFVKAAPINSPNDEENKQAFTIRLTGPVTRATQ